MVVKPFTAARGDIGIDGFFLACRMPHDFTAFANALVGLDVGAGRYFLQEHLDRLGTRLALEGQETGWFGWHGTGQSKRKTGMISEDTLPLQQRRRSRQTGLFRPQAPE